MLIKRKTLYRAIPELLETYLGPQDARVKNFLLFRSPIICLTILTIYWCSIFIIIKIMRRRSAFRLRTLLVLYNFAQVMFSSYIFIEALIASTLSNYQLSCSVLDVTRNPASTRMINVFYCFYVSKIMDLCDTVFFAVRKKNEQMSFLHLYHHSTMVFNWYIGSLYLPGGQTTFSLTINSFVHAVMYTYYMLSAMGPNVRKNLWWKKYLTQIQMGQFIIIMAHLLYGLYIKCPAPLWLLCYTVVYLTTLVLLFGKFYYKTYNLLSKKYNKLTTKTLLDFKAGGDYKKQQ